MKFLVLAKFEKFLSLLGKIFYHHKKYFLLTRSNQSELDKEEELCGLVINVLFTVMWRGASQPKERGSVIASINMLGTY